ncbi:MAG: hypothetical protein ACF8LL_00010 [Phycisphaerales bacterium]
MAPGMTQTETQGADASSDRFSSDTIEAVTQVREACARIIETKCPGSKAVTAVSDAFGIHRKLAWQVVKVAYADDPFIATRHMPPSKSMRSWLKSAKVAGIEGELIENAREAFERLEVVIKTHAGSRAEFEMLIESVGQASDTQTEEKWRQHAFLGNSYTLGVQCRVLMSLNVLMPSEDKDDFFHSVQVRGLMGYRQTRPNVRWVVNQSVLIDDDQKDGTGMTRQPIDADGAARCGGVPVISDFCSDPMPALRRREADRGMMQDELLSGEVGLTGQRTLVTGEILRNVAPTYASSEGRRAHFGVGVRIPTEMLHFDLFVYKGLFGDVEREVRVFSELVTDITFDEKDEIRVSDDVKRLGMGVSLAQAQDIPGYTDLARSVFGRLNADPSDYELYRIRMAYPPMPATVVYRHPMLPKAERG